MNQKLLIHYLLIITESDALLNLVDSPLMKLPHLLLNSFILNSLIIHYQFIVNEWDAPLNLLSTCHSLSWIRLAAHNTRWRRPIGCLKLQVIFRRKAIQYRLLLRKMTYKDKASYDSTPPCTRTRYYLRATFITQVAGVASVSRID